MVAEYTWVLTALSLAGVVLNIRKDRRCFAIWICTNAGWSIYDASIGAYAQASLFGIYFLLSVWGIFEWRRCEKAHEISSSERVQDDRTAAE